MTPDEILARDSDATFIAFMHTFGDVKPTFIERMRQAVMMSGYKYGAVKDKPASHYEMLEGFEVKGLEKDGNHEHYVNIANYEMFIYMVGDHDMSHVEKAVQAMQAWDEEKHVGTDSDKSVTKKRVKPAAVNSFLRNDILSTSAYPYQGGGDNRW